MHSGAVYKGVVTELAYPSDRSAKAFVWSVWLLMMSVALLALIKYGRVFPLTEDWWLVPPLTGNEPDLVNWLWEQNNEHRIPFPRLILLALLKVTHGDFRAGMFLNIVTLGALAFAMICVARQIRGGRTRFVDAFFPIALLHLGNWENLFWSWQLTQIIPVTLTCIILLTLIGQRTLTTPGVELVAGVCLMLLPLSGANGLIFVPLLSLWFLYWGVVKWRAAPEGGQRWVGGFLIGAVLAALGLTGLYFVGYERPTWTPPNPGIWPSFQAVFQFLALGFGPVARSSRTLSILATLILLLPAAVLMVTAALRQRGIERYRALGLLIFSASLAVFALVMGWGRAAVIPIFGFWPLRYVLFIFPIFATVFFIWELYGSPKLRTTVQTALFLVMFFLIPWNTIHGYQWAKWSLDSDKFLMQDLVAGVPLPTIAERHVNLLFPHKDSTSLANMIQMLQEAGMGPFAQGLRNTVIPEDAAESATSPQTAALVTQEIRYDEQDGKVDDSSLVTLEVRYEFPGAGEVFLVWGINGWKPVPAETLLAGTMVKNGVAHTSMVRQDETFIANIHVPAGATVDYGFLTTKTRNGFDVDIWEGNDEPVSAVRDNSVIERQAQLTFVDDQAIARIDNVPLVNQEIRYHMPEAGEVLFAWGVNGWHILPEEIRPAGTTIKDGVMRLPMTRTGDTFVAQVRVPTGAKLEYGFLITDKQGIFDLITPIWDGDPTYQLVVSEAGVSEITSTIILDDKLSELLNKKNYFLAGVVVLFSAWLLIYFSLWLFGQ